jgi:hypothetical protein
VIFSTPRLTALAKALLTAEAGKGDSQLLLMPQLAPVVELSDALTSGNIFTGATTPNGGDQSFSWQDTATQTGISGSQTHTTTQGLTPGIWHFNGHMTLQYTSAAPPNPAGIAFLSLFDNNAPANSMMFARGAIANAQTQLFLPFNLVLNLSRAAENVLGLADWRLKFSTPATLAGDVLTVLMNLRGLRLS